MFYRWIVLSAVLASAGSRPAAAEDELYDVRGPAIKSGLSFRLSAEGSGKQMRYTLSTEGRLRQDVTYDVERKIDADYVVEAADDRRITKIRAHVLNDETKYTFVQGDQEQIDHKISGLVGRDLVSKLEKGNWKHALAEGDPNESQTAALKEFIQIDDESWYPKQKVSIGATWKMPPEKLARALSDGPEPKVTGDLTTKFVEVRSYEGEPCAVLRTTGPIRGTVIREEKEAKIELDVVVTEYRSLRHHLSLKAEVRCALKVAGPVKVGNEEFDQTIEGTLTTTFLTKMSKPVSAK